MNEESIFHAALERSNPADRAQFLDQACGADPELRSRVDALLIAHEGSAELIEGLDPVDLFASAPSQTSTSTDPATAAFVPQSQPQDATGVASTEPETRSDSQEGSTPSVAATGDYRGSAGDRRNGDSIKILEGPGSRIGSYKLIQNIGEGGMGVVFMAEQEKPVRRKVALKIIKPGMDTNQVVARFEAERQALAMMDHQNIARVFDAGATDTGRPYFVMELVCGKPITEFCDGRQMSPRERLELFIQVCKAIQHAHQKGIIHRDIKPSNVLVTIQDGKPVPKVIDFGVAKAVDQSLTEETLFTQHGALVGTLEYMSPEQAEAGALDIDTRSDIYSLGVLLYELLTGTTPIEKVRLRRAAYGEILRRIREEEPPKPSTRLSESGEALPSIASVRRTEPSKLTKLMRGEIDWIVMKSLEKDRKRRYETANAFARDIERYLHDEAVEAGPPSTSYKLRKFARKHRALLVTASGFAALLVVGVAVSSLLAVRATRAERLATARAVELADANKKTTLALIDTRKAQADAVAALNQSETDRKQAEAVSTFMVETLGKAEPGQDGRLVKVVDLLDRAKAKLDLGFEGPPAIKWALLDALGKTYLGLGLYQNAVATFEQVRSERAKSLGDDHPSTLMSRGNLAAAYLAAGRTAEAIELNETTLQRLEAKLGIDHPSTLASRNNLATAYLSAGRPAEAIHLLEAIVKKSEAKAGIDDPFTLTSRNNLASAFKDAGRTGEAIPILEATLKQREAKLGIDHPGTLATRINLAAAYHSAGRIGEAISLLEESLKQMEAKLGIDHPNTLISRNNLASAYKAAGRIADAIPLFEATLQRLEAKLGLDHPHTLMSRNNLAGAYKSAGRTAEAIPLFETTLKQMEAKLGIDHPETLKTRVNLANAYLNAGRFSEAIPLFEKTLEQKEDKLGNDHPETLTSRLNLAKAYLNSGRAAESIPLFELSLKQREANLGADHIDMFLIRNGLAHAYMSVGRMADSIPLHEKNLKLSEAKLAPDHPDTLLTRNNLASAYQAVGRSAEAIPLFEETIHKSEAKLGPDHPYTLMNRNNLAEAYEAEKEWEKAERLRRENLDRARRSAPAESPEIAAALAGLGKNLLFQGKPAEAEPFLRECQAIREKKLADDWLRFNAMSLLGGALSGQKKYAEAEPLVIQGYEGMKARESRIPPQGKSNLPEAAERIVSLYEAWGKPEKAAEWSEKLKLASPAKPDSNAKPAPK